LRLFSILSKFDFWWHVGLGMLVWAYVQHVFATGMLFWIIAIGIFLGVEIVQWSRRKGGFFNLDTILDFIADGLGLFIGFLLWKL
jgi:hypothetical protein